MLVVYLPAGLFLTLISAPVDALPGINLSPLWCCMSHPDADPEYDLPGGMSLTLMLVCSSPLHLPLLMISLVFHSSP